MTSRPGVRARFTILYGIALIITVVLVSSGIYFFVQRALMGQVENHLHKDFSTINQYLKYDQNSLIKMADHGPILLFSVRDGDQPLVSSDIWNRAKLGGALRGRDKAKSLFSIRSENGKLYRVLTGTFVNNGHTYQIAVAHDEESVKQTLKTLALIILLILPIAVAISLAIGYVIAGRVLAPISAITRKAEEISAENLSERLPIGNGDDEFSRLAVVFNQTFTRIEDSFARLRRFTADASHELRTPLASIRSIGEAALHSPDKQGNYREAISSILEETDRLRQLIDALLQLSRADSGEIELRRESVNLAELARETVEFLNVLAEEKHQSIIMTTGEKTFALIDRTSIRQALVNLLDNAIKYSPTGGFIQIAIEISHDGEAVIAISDDGPGIQVEHRNKIYDRFYRVDTGRSREVGGAGLGLSIAQLAVSANNGHIDLEVNGGKGCTFKICLPLSSEHNSN